MEYEKFLTLDQKIQILNSRVSQLVIEGYQNSIGLKVANNLGKQEQIDQINEILNVIEVSLETHKEELEKLLKLKEESE